MISHKHRCIFIHIPRTAGSSIERWITGLDLHDYEWENKHLIASQAKKLYARYWDDYFKFSIVRNPWDRTVSMLNFAWKFGLSYKDKFDFSDYKKYFGYPIVVENNMIVPLNEVRNKKHTENCIYLNILDEPIDFIGKYENLKDDITFLKYKLRIKKPFDMHLSPSVRDPDYRKYYNEEDKEFIRQLYLKDIERFRYEF